MLEFVTLVVLRIREPKLQRSFRVPGGMAGAVTCGLFPLALLVLSIVESEQETILGVNALVFGVGIIAAGFVTYLGMRKVRSKYMTADALETANLAS